MEQVEKTLRAQIDELRGERAKYLHSHEQILALLRDKHQALSDAEGKVRTLEINLLNAEEILGEQEDRIEKLEKEVALLKEKLEAATLPLVKPKADFMDMCVVELNWMHDLVEKMIERGR